MKGSLKKKGLFDGLNPKWFTRENGEILIRKFDAELRVREKITKLKRNIYAKSSKMNMKDITDASFCNGLWWTIAELDDLFGCEKPKEVKDE